MRCLVTGVAGFVGSHLAERLVALGHDVVGVDSFTPYYAPAAKERNIATLLDQPGFSLVRADLADADLAPLVDGVEWVFHLAGQPGVRGSWGDQFAEYVRHNIEASQRLLEALRAQPPLRLVYASSSSIYGDTPLPMREDARPSPLSPYGVTKLAGEHLMHAYWTSYGVPTVALRFFTVYGPRQRPDMAFNRFIHAIAEGERVQLYGDGRQTRDFTYVSDVVDACLRAATHDCAGAAINVGGGSSVTVNAVLDLLGGIIGQPVHVEHQAGPRGDAPHTAAAMDRADSLLDWQPQVSLADGLARQVEWQVGITPSSRRTFAAPAIQLPRQGPRLLIYGHDTYGLGHLRRNLTVATELIREIPDLSILLLTGSPAVQQFPLPPNADYVKLPAVIKLADEDYHARTLRMQPAEIVQMRAALAREAVVTFAPDVLLVDHAPIGMKGELLPALRQLRQTRPETRIVLGLRDIVDEPKAVRANWAERGIYHALEHYYDTLLVYGIPGVMDVVTAYQLSPAVAARTHYCGYLRRAPAASDARAVRDALCAPHERLVLVTAGGGGDGFSLLQTYLAGLGTSVAPADVVSVVVTGPFMPAEERGALEALAESHPRVRLLEFTDDMLGLMSAADLVICMGGYNTLCEVLSVGAPALVVPRVEPRREQLLRASAFEQLGLVAMLHPDRARPDTLARRTAELLDGAPNGAGAHAQEALAAFVDSGALGGLDAMATAIAALLRPDVPASARAG